MSFVNYLWYFCVSSYAVGTFDRKLIAFCNTYAYSKGKPRICIKDIPHKEWPDCILALYIGYTRIKELFFVFRVSYLEIYNERVNDLLNKSGTDLKLKEDGTGQVVLQCKEEITNSPESVLCIMKRGDKHRRIGETNMNERSSRSHTIFRIVSFYES